MWVCLHGVFLCGLLRTVCTCWEFILFGGTAYDGVKGKWYEFVERQGFVWWVGGGGLGLRVWGFRAGRVLAGHRRSCWGICCVHHLDGCF